MRYQESKFVDAWQWDELGDTFVEIKAPIISCCTSTIYNDKECDFIMKNLYIETIHGKREVKKGSWIVRDSSGFRVYSDEYFQRIFKPVED
jgi:hypothetical protein